MKIPTSKETAKRAIKRNLRIVSDLNFLISLIEQDARDWQKRFTTGKKK